MAEKIKFSKELEAEIEYIIKFIHFINDFTDNDYIDTNFFNDELEKIWRYEDKKLWGIISSSFDLSDEFINTFDNFLDWNLLCKKLFYSRVERISSFLLLKHQNEIKDWDYVSSYPYLSLDMINDLSEFLDFNKIIFSYNENITEEFIEKYKDRIDWDEISNKINLYRCRKYHLMMDYINYEILLKNCSSINIEFIKNNYSFIKNRIGDIWQYLSLNKRLSMRFIDNYKDKLYMDNLIDSLGMYRQYILKNVRYFSFEALKKCDKINENDKLRFCSILNLENNNINLNI